jgi:uroporphyrinogen III methyltransferase/synthase
MIVIGAVAAIDLSWFEARPLFGRRVVVTRSAERATGLVHELTELGAGVTEAPSIAIADPDDRGAALRAAADRLATYDWVVFTSANAVGRLFALVHDARAFGHARVAAVGDITARALAASGIVPDLVPDSFTADDLVAVFPAGAGAVLVPQSMRARPTVVDGLAAKGWKVDAVVAYQTVSMTPPDDVLADAATADAIVFTSPSTIDGWVDVAAKGGLPPVVACIGPVTAEAARSRGVPVTVVAEDHTASGLASALAANLRQ